MAQTPETKEIRRCTHVVGIFPDRLSIIRLIDAVLMEQTDEWIESRRCMGAKSSSNPKSE